MRQLELSDTRDPDRLQAGRVGFDGLIRYHLDINRPQQVVLVFDRPLTGSHARQVLPSSFAAASTLR